MIDLGRRRFVVGGGLTALGVAIAPSVVMAIRRRAALDELAAVDPALREIALDDILGTEIRPALSDATLGEVRKSVATWPIDPTVPYYGRVIPGPRGAPDVTLYVINAKPGDSRPAIVHTHGGGFVAGSAKAEIGRLQIIAKEVGCAIVTVEYRLAPETLHAGSMEDNYCALIWTYRNARALGIDPVRIALMGESAGGCHAALLALTARDRAEVPIVLQMLIYPMLDDRTGSTVTVPRRLSDVVWTLADNRYAWGAFLGERPGGARVPEGAVPARIDDLSGLAPAFIGVGELDLFVNEDTVYARRLKLAGVSTALHIVPGVYHNFDNHTFAPVTRSFIRLRDNTLRKALAVT